MSTLKQRMQNPDEFLVGVEVVSTRGTMAEEKAVKSRDLTRDLTCIEDIDWLSITDNAGGNPMLKPISLGNEVRASGKNVVIHLTCKDQNRNGIESEAWHLASEGFENILALTGDYPIDGHKGNAKPVFDIDSVGLISMLRDMNTGLTFQGPKRVTRLRSTNFFIGAAATNIKLYENEVVPQYLKLEKKIAVGAEFIINQIGYDSRKHSEMIAHLRHTGRASTPLIGNVYLLSGGVARFFNASRIPGVVVSDELRDLCIEQAKAPDKGKAFFIELAAKQVAIYRGLGYRGVYFGGIHQAADLEDILDLAKQYADDDWKTAAREIRFSRPGEFFLHDEDPLTGLATATERNTSTPTRSPHVTTAFKINHWMHQRLFTAGSAAFARNARFYEKSKQPDQGPKWLRKFEQLTKSAMFDCRDCGDCSLPDTAYLCPESQCAKNQRNGPCGGTLRGGCEVDESLPCIWARAYDRMKYLGRSDTLLDHAPVIQDQGLRGLSAWSTTYRLKDHHATANKKKLSNPTEPTHS